MTPEQELELLKLKAKAAVAATSRPQPMSVSEISASFGGGAPDQPAAPQTGNMASRFFENIADQRVAPGIAGDIVSGGARIAQSIAEDPLKALIVDPLTAPARTAAGVNDANAALMRGDLSEAGNQAINATTAGLESALMLAPGAGVISGRAGTVAGRAAPASGSEFVRQATQAGIDPTLAARFPRTAGGFTKAVADNPITALSVEGRAKTLADQSADAVKQAAQAYSPNAEVNRTGETVIDAAKRFAQSREQSQFVGTLRIPKVDAGKYRTFRDMSDDFYARVDSQIDPAKFVLPESTRRMSAHVTTRSGNALVNDLLRDNQNDTLRNIIEGVFQDTFATREAQGQARRLLKEGEQSTRALTDEAARLEGIAADIRMRNPAMSQQEVRARANAELQRGLREAGAGGAVKQSQAAQNEAMRARLRTDRTAREIAGEAENLRGAAGMNTPAAPMAEPNRAAQLTVSDLRTLRTHVRQRQNQAAINKDQDEAALEALESALTDDIYRAVGEQSPKALHDLKRADRFYRQGVTRIQTALKPFMKEGATEESAFREIINSARNPKDGGNSARIMTLKRALKPQELDEVASGVIANLGKPRGGGDFSVETFAREWKALSPAAKRALFARSDRPELLENLDNLASVLEKQASVESLTNRSRSGAVATTFGLGGLFFAEPLTAIATAAGAAGLGRLMLSPTFTKAILETGAVAAKTPQAAASIAPAKLRAISALVAVENSDEAVASLAEDLRRQLEAQNDNFAPAPIQAQQQ